MKKYFWDFFKIRKNQKFQWKINIFPIEKILIFHWHFWFSRILEKISKNIFYFFFDHKKNIFWSRKKSWGQLRCRKVRSFDFWCFQTDSGTPSWVSKPKPKKSLFFVLNVGIRSKIDLNLVNPLCRHPRCKGKPGFCPVPPN